MSETFAKAYKEGYQQTVRLLQKRGANRDLATEIAQEAWVRGWVKRGQLRNNLAVVSWVNSIAVNLMRSVLRGKRQIPISALNGAAKLVSKPSVNLAAIDVEHLSRACTNRQRTFVDKYAIAGFTTEEIAVAEKTTAGAVQQTISRARAMMRHQAGITAKVA
jgi:RNA polymerase sigma factor (sigma-70 family)